MSGQAWGAKRERQYEDIKQSQLDEDRLKDRAEEVAARTVNKQRTRAGESRQKSKTSTRGKSAPSAAVKGLAPVRLNAV